MNNHSKKVFLYDVCENNYFSCVTISPIEEKALLMLLPEPQRLELTKKLLNSELGFIAETYPSPYEYDTEYYFCGEPIDELELDDEFVEKIIEIHTFALANESDEDLELNMFFGEKYIIYEHVIPISFDNRNIVIVERANDQHAFITVKDYGLGSNPFFKTIFSLENIEFENIDLAFTYINEILNEHNQDELASYRQVVNAIYQDVE